MNRSSPLRRLWTYASRHGSTVRLAAACSFLNKVFDIAPEILIGMLIDVVVSRGDSLLARLGVAEPVAQLQALAALTLVIWVLESFFEYCYQILWRNLAQTIQHELRLEAYARVQKLDMSYFEDKHSASLVATLNDDVNQLERFLDGGANDLIQVFSTVVLIGAIFFALAPVVAVFAMMPIPVILGGAFWYEKRAEPLYAAVRNQAAAISERLANSISGIATVKAYTAEERELKRVEEESLEYARVNSRAIRMSSAFIPIIRMAILAGFLATLLIGGEMALGGTLAVGSYGVLVFLTQRLLWPLTGLAQTVDLYRRAMASAARVLDLVEAPIAMVHGGRSLPPNSVKGELRFEDVSFSYPGRPPALKGITLTIPAGSTAAFVGATGSGKTTLTKLILRFHDPGQGRLILDGTDVVEYDPRELRRAIGFVSQDVFLFHGSARENIAYGDPSSAPGAVEAAARAAEASEFLAKLPQGYDTVIGERGQKLSGGQRQRLAIARAVLKNPPILVFDEATSAVDNETEAAIQKSLSRIAVGRTTIIVAHRLSTIVKADRIFVLQEGGVVESGTHRELLDAGGVYAGLWHVQTGA